MKLTLRNDNNISSRLINYQLFTIYAQRDAGGAGSVKEMKYLFAILVVLLVRERERERLQLH